MDPPPELIAHQTKQPPGVCKWGGGKQIAFQPTPRTADCSQLGEYKEQGQLKFGAQIMNKVRTRMRGEEKKRKPLHVEMSIQKNMSFETKLSKHLTAFEARP